MFKKYKIGFDIWGLLLFLIIMIPTFIWFAVPAPNDILRVDSITKAVDTSGSICQVLMTIPPCLAFIFFAIARKNMIAIIPISLFTICHLIYGIVNFVIQ